MSFIPVNREQLSFFGYSIDDFVSSDAKCRFVVDLVSRLNLNKLFARYSSQGGDAYDPGMMLAAWFYAYSRGITSTRKLEECCRHDLRFIYITGNLKPDHTSFSRFRKANLDLMPDYFVQIVQLALGNNLSDFKEISIDGTKIQASCSPKQCKNSDELARKLSEIRKSIDEYMKRCEISEAEEMEEDDLVSVRKKLSRLQELEKKLVNRQRELEDRKKELKKEHRANHQINITEPEAPNMLHVNGNQKLPAYNAQISVDSGNRMIVSNDVVQDRNDQNQFVRQHQGTEMNLGTDPERQYTMDAGYHSKEQLAYVYENRIDAMIADPSPDNRSADSSPSNLEVLKDEGRDLKRSDFSYHGNGDYYECPAGRRLEFIHIRNRGKYRWRVYRSNGCTGCPLLEQCVPKNKNTKVRSIYRDDRELYAENMLKRVQTEEGKSRLKQRAITAEPVFGNLKENLGFRRFRLRGLNQVKGEFNLMCIAHNINLLYGIIIQSAFSSPSFYAQYRYFRFQVILKKSKSLMFIIILLQLTQLHMREQKSH